VKLSKDELRRLQLSQLEILKVVDSLCDKYNIKYSLYGGSLIGAIRHQGFIPWDDDLDIAMSRAEYRRFINVWQTEHISGLLFQDYNTDKEFNQTFGKIRMRNTAFIAVDEVGTHYHHGIFIDIFPIDRIPGSRFKRKIYFIYGCLYLLYTRKHPTRRNGSALKYITRFILKITPKTKVNHFRDRLLKKLIKFNDKPGCEYICYSSYSALKRYLNKNLLDNTVKVSFEDTKLQIFENYDDYLIPTYGDYMNYPDKSDRIGSHNIAELSYDKEK
jgi:lipopolysaccharide cholinephosphotransferase